ncbi:MAG: nicotinate-nucleotide adenylyltransferase [Planctomycetia bacterium]|nr:nicotinate-nucleotide adenylyltransferase [Planctomycetia bacterium]
MRVGIFGGSFDPVHIGHLILAEQCLEQGMLDRVDFVPAPRPPHKAQGTHASFEQRAQMLSAALQGHSQFSVNTCEQNRPGLSYTVDTLRHLHTSEPGNEWYLILGMDSVHDLETWRDPQGIAKLCTLMIVKRPGIKLDEPPEYFRSHYVDAPLIEISSTDIRQRVADQRSIRYLVPDSVRTIIEKEKWYRPVSG